MSRRRETEATSRTSCQEQRLCDRCNMLKQTPIIILHRSKFTVIKQPLRAIVMIFIVKNTPHLCCAWHVTSRLLTVTLERQAESTSHGLILCLHGWVLFCSSHSTFNISGQGHTILHLKFPNVLELSSKRKLSSPKIYYYR